MDTSGVLSLSREKGDTGVVRFAVKVIQGYSKGAQGYTEGTQIKVQCSGVGSKEVRAVGGQTAEIVPGLLAGGQRAEKNKMAKELLGDLDSLTMKSVEEEELERVKAEWASSQEKLRKEVILEDTGDWGQDLTKLKLVCGMDISFPKEDDTKAGVACVVICSFPKLAVVHEVTREIEVELPYIPGYLAFREALPLVEILREIVEKEPDLKPDVILVDGNGLLHPRRYGCACHIGMLTGIPTIGVAKNLYKLEDINYDKSMAEDMESTGDDILIRQEDSILGMALKTSKDAKNPVFVSVGHKVSLQTAKQVVLRCCKYRVPEPIRFADFSSREIIRKSSCQPTRSRTE